MIDLFDLFEKKILISSFKWLDKGFLIEKSYENRLIDCSLMLIAFIGAIENNLFGWGIYSFTILFLFLKINYDGLYLKN